MRDYVRRMFKGELDGLLVYRKRLRRSLQDYQQNVPPHVRAARIADEFNRSQGRPQQYQNRGDSLCDDNGRPGALETQRSPIDYEHYLTRQLQPVADAIRPILGNHFALLISRQQNLF
ncbi:MAG: hypothetical protein ACKOVA_01015 [Novosphingobium sp.]